jgi:hypothetical protein
MSAIPLNAAPCTATSPRHTSTTEELLIDAEADSLPAPRPTPTPSLARRILLGRERGADRLQPAAGVREPVGRAARDHPGHRPLGHGREPVDHAADPVPGRLRAARALAGPALRHRAHAAWLHGADPGGHGAARHGQHPAAVPGLGHRGQRHRGVERAAVGPGEARLRQAGGADDGPLHDGGVRRRRPAPRASPCRSSMHWAAAGPTRSPCGPCRPSWSR